MPCSAVTLSLATICGVASAALLGIAFGTDNWQEFRVSGRILGKFPQGVSDPEINSLYLTRTKGLFRTCFDGERPDSAKVPTYISPVETNCMNIDYYFGMHSSIGDLEDDAQARLYMLRTMVGLFIVSFVFLFVSFFTGLSGCWRRSPGNIGATAILILFACLFSAGSMGLWHGIDYYEKEKLNDLPYRAGWTSQLSDNTKVSFAWSYFIAWVGVGASLVSSLLFFGASVCLRTEREKEDAKNMAYIMPVYGQKQQQQQYGYGYGGYPGPYHYAGQPQYGHYNY